MIILASASPRRQELLKMAVKDFSICPADVDETLPENISAENAAEYLAIKKAQAVASSPEHIYDSVIGCDTIVVLEGEIMGKPRDINHAREMLTKLSGRVHKVITGVCVCSRGKQISFSETTEVEFYPLSEKEIEDYIRTGDPMDKAGSYGIQSEGCMLVKGIKGDFFNVVGLPVARLKRELDKMVL
ncbi:MAG: Maf family protein [Oscillospiraceae bacterium]|nr:Maf family protein [Oscillospiraceae bacterium]